MKKRYFLLAIIASLVLPFTVQATISSTDMVTYTGSAVGDTLGRALATGDFNGDGYTDIVMGAHSADSSVTGKIFIIYGDNTTLTDTTLSTTDNINLTGSSVGDNAGVSVAVGDVNGDGYDDIATGAISDDTGNTDGGAVYLVYGQATAHDSGNLTDHVVFVDENANDRLGQSVTIGDFDNDGFDDIAFGAHRNTSNTGEVYVFYGSDTDFSGEIIAGTADAIIAGSATNNRAGVAVASGDVNGDDYADLLVGSATASPNSLSAAGSVNILYGSEDHISSQTLGTASRIDGEAAGDNFGTFINANGDVTNDGYNDILVGAPYQSDNGALSGSVYLIQGSASEIGSGLASAHTQFMGEAAGDSAGVSVALADYNQDGFADITIGAYLNDDVATDAGSVYMITGGADNPESMNVSQADYQFTGSAANDTFGLTAITSSVNGDAYPELLVGAVGNGASVTGAVYVGYLMIDQDGDSVLSSDGLITAGEDCNDNDAGVSENQTYYIDADADGLGDSATSIDACSSTPPEGYADNASDTDDTIPNNGVEIDGDDVDNDEDGTIDEVNTVAENGEHPYYGNLDPTDSTVTAANITSISSNDSGAILVGYADDSIYAFPTGFSKIDNAQQYTDLGYALAVRKNGKKLVLVNLFTGDKDALTTSAKRKYATHTLEQKDFRNDNKTEALFVGTHKQHVLVSLIRIKKNSGTLKLLDKTTVENDNVVPGKSKLSTKMTQLRSAKKKVLEKLNVTKKYLLK